MLFSVKSFRFDISSFFHCLPPAGDPLWRYVLLSYLNSSHIAHILKNVWFNLLCKCGGIQPVQGLRSILATKFQQQVIRVIPITYV